MTTSYCWWGQRSGTRLVSVLQKTVENAVNAVFSVHWTMWLSVLVSQTEGWENEEGRRTQGERWSAQRCNPLWSALIPSSPRSDPTLNEFGSAGKFSPEQTADGLKRKHLDLKAVPSFSDRLFSSFLVSVLFPPVPVIFCSFPRLWFFLFHSIHLFLPLSIDYPISLFSPLSFSSITLFCPLSLLSTNWLIYYIDIITTLTKSPLLHLSLSFYAKPPILSAFPSLSLVIFHHFMLTFHFIKSSHSSVSFIHLYRLIHCPYTHLFITCLFIKMRNLNGMGPLQLHNSPFLIRLRGFSFTPCAPCSPQPLLFFY